MSRWMLLLAAVALAAGCADAPAQAPVVAAPAPAWPAIGEPLADPLANGPHSWATSDYDLGKVMVGGDDAGHDGYEYESRIRGTITMPDGPGPFPLAVFLHGQHQTGTDAEPYRNDKGYLYLMEHLASHGIATASILAHEINNENGNPDIGMWARGELVLATIDALEASDVAPRIDFARIGLMGHSRGGEGVVTAAEVNAGRADPHSIAALIALAPTDFAFRDVPGIPFLALAPYCDGDVYSLHGLRQFDQSRYTDHDAVKVQLLVMGANHNNYNTMWGKAVGGVPLVGAEGDDAGFGRHQNTHCDLPRDKLGGRLTLEETYAEATLHLAGFLRWTLLGEASLAPYFLGAQQPAAACPDQTDCPGAVHVSAMTPGRRDLFSVGQDGPVAAAGVKVGPAAACHMQTCAENVYSSAWMADLPMLNGGASLRVDFDGPADLRETPVLQVRVGVPTDKSVNAFGPPRMAVTFVDTTGSHAVTVDDPALFLPPGLIVDPGVGAIGLAYVGGAKVAANSVVLPIPADVDLGNVTAIEFTFTGAGPQGQALPDRVLVADAWLNRATSAAYTPTGLTAV
ncbi:MAG: hypothetical protein QOJ26_1818 [Thermoplasmata archaeon]|nr:hypothetical protein [Thermoplasmata archaeon]